jgi:2-polyprenyl-6-methoxyphenol hydroxylase-like FAD-dependent oxidoreductase
VLAAAVAHDSGDLDAALATYERLRVPRATAAVLGSRARARENHLTSRWRQVVRDVKLAVRDRIGLDTTVVQVDQLYGYDVGQELQ